jgi:hypothetical protein
MAFNGFQFVCATENIYFKEWESRASVASSLAEFVDQRAKDVSRTTIFVPDGGTTGREQYRLATAGERRTAKETLSMTAFLNAAPAHWPSVMTFRSKPREFFTGTAAGYVRHPEWFRLSESL